MWEKEDAIIRVMLFLTFIVVLGWAILALFDQIVMIALRIAEHINL